MPSPAPRSSTVTNKLRTLALLAALLGGLVAGCSSPAPTPEAVFVSLPAADALIKLDPESGQVLAHTVVGMLPHNLLLSRDGTKVYAALVGSQAVAELDAATGALLRTFLSEPLPAAREDGSLIEAHSRAEARAASSCFACHHGGADGARPAVVGARPFGLVLSEDGRQLYVSHIKSGALSVIELSSGRLAASVRLEPVGEAHEATGLARLDGELFVTLLPTLPTLEPHPPGIVRRLSAATLRPLGDTETGRNTPILLADEARRQVYLSNAETNTVSRLDAEGRLVGAFTVGNSPYGQVLLDDRTLLVANFYDGSLSRVDLETSMVESRNLELGGVRYSNPTHLALAQDGEHVYLVSSTPEQGHLLVIDTSTLQVERALPMAGLGFDLVTVP